jgi:hypothetical protein
VKPGNADIGIKGVDSSNGVFPPCYALGTAFDLSSPLHLAPGSHSIKIQFGRAFLVHPNPGPDTETVQVEGSGTIEAQFLENHAYRLTALWIDESDTFFVTLWDVTVSDDSPAAVQQWSFPGRQVLGPPGYG